MPSTCARHVPGNSQRIHIGWEMPSDRLRSASETQMTMDSARSSVLARGASLGSNLSTFSKGLLLVAIPVLLQLAVLAVLRDFQSSAIEAERCVDSKQEHHRESRRRAAARRGGGGQSARRHQRRRRQSSAASQAGANDPAPARSPRSIDELSALVKESPAQLERVARVRELAARLETWIAEQRRLVAAGRQADAFARGGRGQAQALLARIDERDDGLPRRGEPARSRAQRAPAGAPTSARS